MTDPTPSPIFEQCIVNGELLPTAQAKISLFNSAYFSSFGVYETVKIDRGRPFYLAEHLRRLHHSARLIDLSLPPTPETLHSWFDQLIAVDPQATWGLKIVALGPDEGQSEPLVAMQAVPLPTYPADFYRQGASAVLYEGSRLLPACKSLNTLVNSLARRRAGQAHALEGLLHHHGYLTEGSRSNLFAVQGGQVVTPPTAQVLSGITRDIILQVMEDNGQPVCEAPVGVTLWQYDEFFISSTSMHVMPITRIDGQVVGNGQVGPLTRQVMARFEAHYRDYMGQPAQT